MNIQEVLKIKTDDELLAESGIRLPKGTKAAKITCHSDMDGFFSGLLAYHQLQKQGINANNITVSFIQYGGEEEDTVKQVSTRNKQASVVVDFAALPQSNLYDIVNKASNYKISEESFIKFLQTVSKGNLNNKEAYKTYVRKALKNDVSDEDLEKMHRALKMFDFKKAKEPFNKEDYDVSLTKPDFISDHHQDTKGSLTKGKSGTIAAKDKEGHAFKSDSEHISVSYAPNLADYSSIKAVTNIDSAKYSDIQNTIDLPKDFKAKGRMERLAILVNTLLSDVIKRNKTLTVEIMKASSPSLVNVYNNILKMGKFNNQQVDIYEEMIKSSPDWNKISSLRSGMPKSMAKETTVKDLKGLKKLNTIDDWREKGKEDVAKAKSGYWTKENEDELEKTKNDKSDTHLDAEQERTSKTKLAAIDNIKKKIAKMDEFKNKGKEEDYNYSGDSHIKTSKKMFDTVYKNEKEHLEKLEKDYVKMFPSNKEKLDNLKDKKENSKSQFTTVGNVMRQDATSTRDYPTRFMGSMLNKSGIRYPFHLKRFSTFMQIAINPDASDEIRKNADLGKISDEILDKIKAKFGTMYNNWAFEIIKKESGGHSGITNVAGLGTLGLMPKKDRERYTELDALNKRGLAVGTSLAKIAKKNLKNGKTTLSQEYKSLKDKREFSAKARTEIMDEIEKMFYEELAKHKGLITTKQPNKERFDLNARSHASSDSEAVEESLNNIIKDLLVQERLVATRKRMRMP